MHQLNPTAAFQTAITSVLLTANFGDSTWCDKWSGSLACFEKLMDSQRKLLHHHRFTALFRDRDHPGELSPQENFWTLWCKGRLTEAKTSTSRLGATPSRLTSAHLHHPPIFYRPDALPATQPTVSKHWRQQRNLLHWTTKRNEAIGNSKFAVGCYNMVLPPSERW